MFKAMARRAISLLMFPFRRTYRQRNGCRQQQVQHMQLPNNVLLGMARNMLRQGHTVTINVKGYSMRPFLEHERDKVLLSAPGELHVGDAVLAEITPGTYVLHRIIELDGQRVTLMGDGNVRGTEHCQRTDVAGVVTQYIRPRRTIDASDTTLQRRIRLWRKLLPVRRFLLFVYRAGFV